MRIIEMVLGVALLAPSAARAQVAPAPQWPVPAGSRVRIMSAVLGDQRQTGTVVSAGADTLVFRPARDASAITVPTPNIVKMEIVTGTHTRKMKGGLLGMLIGAVAGAALGAAAYKDPGPCFCILPDTRSFDAALGGFLLGVVGTGVGVIVGARHTDTWTPVAVPHSAP
jgi:hypothetical protein